MIRSEARPLDGHRARLATVAGLLLVAGCAGGPQRTAPTASPTERGAQPPASAAVPSSPGSADLAEYEELAATTRSPDGRREVRIIRSGDGRDLRVATDGAPARSIGEVAMQALHAAAAGTEGRKLSTVQIQPLGWEGPRRLRLGLEGWSAGREPPNLPPVEVLLDVETGLVIPAAPRKEP
jgi:hypothetical protein